MKYAFLFLSVILLISCKQDKNLKPVDFDAFWETTLEDLNSVPMDFEKIGNDSLISGKKVSLYKIRSYKNIFFFAWIAEPVDGEKHPVKIRFSGLDENNMKDNRIAHLWFLKQPGFITMLVDVRGQGLSSEQIKTSEFISEGLKNKEQYIYRGVFMDAVRSVDFVSKQTHHNGNIIVTGGSQGGALSFVSAALNKKVTLCIASFPFLTDMAHYDKKKWPLKVWFHKAKVSNIDYFDLYKTLSYFDLLHFSDKIEVPVFIRTEAQDEITPPEGAVKLFKSISGQKKMLYIEPCKGHGCSTNSTVANELEKVFIRENLLGI